MAITKPIQRPDQRNKRATLVLLGLLAVVGLTFLISYLRRPPQMGASDEVFRTVDALYTAVRNQDPKRLDQCQERLRAYREAGKMPAAAARALDGIIAKARAGSWQSAAERLYDFMLAQKREGPAEPHPKKPAQASSRS